MDNISKIVNSYKTKNKEGFVQSEIEDLFSKFPNIDKDKFNDALRGNTCMMIDNEFVMYHIDIEKALRCGIEKRSLTQEEWD